MNFEFEKLMAKISGENTEKFSERVISETDKNQINFALDQMFQGVSLIEWMKPKNTLADAWRTSLDKMRDFIFSLPGQNYVIDYLHMAIFEHRQKMLKIVSDSLHANEYINYPVEQYPELEKSANEKITTSIDILQNILSTPDVRTNTENQKVKENTNILSKEHEHERDLERARK